VGLINVIADELDVARRRSLALTDGLSEDALCRQHSPLMSPLVWDLAHVGNYEDQWLLRAITGRADGRPELDDLYDAFQHPRATRSGLAMLEPDAARAYIGGVRGQALDLLERTPLDDARPLLRDGFVYGMVIQHEHQHAETMLATRKLAGLSITGADLPSHEVPIDAESEIHIPGGEFMMGTDLEPWAYDNERPAHPVVLAPFWLDATPVANAAYQNFIDDDGYADRRWWSDDGWAWRLEARLEQPEFWEPRWPDAPVQHVCWHEAMAYAAWAGRRLPTEAEWEFAAAGADPADANLGQRFASPLPAACHPGAVSKWGVRQMLGDVWEWTASDFAPYPGFRTFPYREYSEVFFGPEYKVLRGGSWATHPTAIRTTFRNWDYPIRRQIFAGFRCARDAAPHETR
jgi:iron(II)-dependent oxidoreductase